jgi:hypothetical protein
LVSDAGEWWRRASSWRRAIDQKLSPGWTVYEVSWLAGGLALDLGLDRWWAAPPGCVVGVPRVVGVVGVLGVVVVVVVVPPARCWPNS